MRVKNYEKTIAALNEKITKKETLNITGYGETKTKETLNSLVEKNLIVRVG